MEISAETGRARFVRVVRLTLIWLVIMLPVAVASVQRASPPTPTAVAAQGAVTARVAAAANAFLATLSDAERADKRWLTPRVSEPDTEGNRHEPGRGARRAEQVVVARLQEQS